MSKRTLAGVLLTCAIITLMVALAELTGEKEIIFPEIAAIAVGLLIAPRRPWQTNKVRTFGLITLSAVVGLSINYYVPYAKPVQLALAFTLAQLLYVYSGTSFAPLISAAALPVLLGTRSPIYLVAAMGLTALILLAVKLLEDQQLCTAEDFQPLPLPDKHQLYRALQRCLWSSLVIAAALQLGALFVVAPPILVAFTEFTQPHSPARQKPFAVVLLIFACALLGSASRLLLTQQLGLPLTVAAAVATCAMVLVLQARKMYLPPAGALTVLAFLVPAQTVPLYPLQVLTGVGIFMFLAVTFFRRQNAV